MNQYGEGVQTLTPTRHTLQHGYQTITITTAMLDHLNQALEEISRSPYEQHEPSRNSFRKRWSRIWTEPPRTQRGYVAYAKTSLYQMAQLLGSKEAWASSGMPRGLPLKRLAN